MAVDGGSLEFEHQPRRKFFAMKHSFCFLFLVCSCSAFAQELITEKDITYGKATDFRNRLSDLKFDVTTLLVFALK